MNKERPPIEKIRETSSEKRARMRKLERELLYAELRKAPEKKRRRLLGGTLLLASALTGMWWYFNRDKELDDEARDVQNAGEARGVGEKSLSLPLGKGEKLQNPSESKKLTPAIRREFQERLRRLLEQAEVEEIDDPGIAREQNAYQGWLNKRRELLEEIGVELANLLHDDWTTMDETDWQALVDWARDVEARRNALNASPFSLSPDVPFLPAIDVFSYYGLDSVREAIEEKQFEVAYYQLLSLRNQIATDQTSMKYVLGEASASDDGLL